MSAPPDDDAAAGRDDAYLWDGSGEPSSELRAIEQALTPLGADVPDNVVPLVARRRRRWFAVGVASAALVAAAIFLLMLRVRPAGCARAHGFAFTATGGAARCGGARLVRGELAPGDRLDTFGTEVTLTIADIGSAQVAPGSRVALTATSPTEHRLRLERGALHARVNAMPRLFVVETPAATAIDLGCEYTLRVGPDGRGELIVLSGAVELTSASGPVTVPAGMRSQLVPGQGGTSPLRADAPTALYDTAMHGAPLIAAISTVRAEDAVSWLHLAVGREASERELVRSVLASVGVPSPSGALDDAALRRWITELVWHRATGTLPDASNDGNGPSSKQPSKQPYP